MLPEAVKFLLLFLIICISGIYAGPPSKIINGTEASSIPYQVSIITSAGMHICGGSIIDEIYILTAAHCVVDDSGSYDEKLEVIIGTNDRFDYDGVNQYGIAEMIAHEDYAPDNSWKNDIALLKLMKNIKFTEYQKPIPLPSKDVIEGTLVMASGWGITQRYNHWSPARYLQKITQTVISNKECQKIMPSVTIHDEHICAWSGGQGSVCTYDSGGPVVDDSALIGIVSFNEYCKPAYPDVFTRVYSYVPWIRKTIANSLSNTENRFDVRKYQIKKILEN